MGLMETDPFFPDGISILCMILSFCNTNVKIM